MNSYQRYKKKKRQFSQIHYCGVDFGASLGSYVGLIEWGIKRKFLFALTLLFKKYSLKYYKGEKYLCTYYLERSDYKELRDFYLGRIDGVRTEKIEYRFSFLHGLRSFYYIVDAILIFAKSPCSSLSDFLLILFCVRNLKYLEGSIFCQGLPEKYIAFNSAYEYESIITSFLRSKGVKTASFQHAHFVRYLDPKPFDVISYDNICSEVLFSWGPMSHEMVVSQSSVNVDVVRLGPPFDLPPSRVENHFGDSVYVILPRAMFSDYSAQLIVMLESREESFVVRAHPSDSESARAIEQGKNLRACQHKTLLEALSRPYRAVLSFNSTAIFTALGLGHKVLLFHPDQLEFVVDGVFEVRSSFELDAALDAPLLTPEMPLQNVFYDLAPGAQLRVLSEWLNSD